ncbi:unnamed protein product [Spirodela intermedia]|uniref:Protein kinase domain-containing protein n=1 Tax=Spirodela intermedia TaxID=51605 RepID=A0A7I8IT06_SPIIN|nr:unnamed protein product [Spirodela intermedia]CAA6660084.1 unnamed protein product [Spirodela intermedia]
MATGKHGRHQEGALRSRDREPEASRRKDYRPGDSGGQVGSVRKPFGHDNQDLVRDRPNDVIENGVTNGFSRATSSGSSSSSGSGGEDGYRTRHLNGRSADREPGELSSGNGSDETDVSSLENGAASPPTKRRKFSPVMWGSHDDEQFPVLPAGSKNSEINVPLPPPPPPLPQGFVPSKSIAIVNPVESLSAIDADISVTTAKEKPWSTDLESGHLEEDEDSYIPTWNIAASRWAEGNGSLSRKSLKIIKYPEPVSTRLHHKGLTPEPGEVIIRECSEGSTPRSSDSRELGEKSHDFDVDNNDYMSVDEEDAPMPQPDADSEAESELTKTLTSSHPPLRCINMLQSCRSVDEFERLNKINEGTYGVVYRAKDKKTGEVVALKKVKMEKEREGFPLTSLREINILLSLHHPSIVDVKEVVVGSSLDSIFMVMEYMEHDLKGLMDVMKQPFSQSEVKCLMLQLLEGVKYLHDNWVLHRDLKTSNLLVNNHGDLKICDFGLSRQYGSPLKPYTHLVVTLWYRAPELLLGAKEYSTDIDMWSLGCIMAELLAKEPLFGGRTEVDQLDKIFRILGTPNERIWPGFAKLPGVKVNFIKQPYNKLREKFPATSFCGRPTLSEAGFDLLNQLLTYDPEKRITADAALNHEWFCEVPLPKSKDFMPTFPAQNAQDRRSRRILRSPDPLEEQRRKELEQGEIGSRGLFG